MDQTKEPAPRERGRLLFCSNVRSGLAGGAVLEGTTGALHIAAQTLHGLAGGEQQCGGGGEEEGDLFHGW